MTDDRDLRPDPEMERRIGSWLTDTDLTPAEADVGLDDLLREFPVTPQARRRLLGRWFDRDEGVRRRPDDHEYRPDTRRRLMFTTTTAMAIIAALALGVSVINTDQGPPDAGVSDVSYVVAADGSGDFDTIQAAVDAAVDGDSILIMPGIYTESVVIDKPITLTGDAGGDVVIAFSTDTGTYMTEGMVFPVGLKLDASDATVSGLTISGPDPGSAVLVQGGSPTLEDLTIVLDATPADSMPMWIAFDLADATTATIRGSTWDGYLDTREGASPIIEGNTIGEGTIGEGTVSVNGPGETTLTGNTLVDGAEISASGAHGLIEGNTFEDARIGIDEGSDIVVRGNTFRDVGFPEAAIRVDGPDTAPLIEGNTVTGGWTGISAYGGSPTLKDNSVEGARTGLVVGAKATPTLVGNTICGNELNLEAPLRTEPLDTTGNEICEDAPAE
jgi:hypothetical protein